MAAERLQNRPCGGRYGDIIQAIGHTPLVELQAAEPEARGADLGEARVAQPDRLGQGSRRAGADRGRRGEGPDRPAPDAARAHLGQHRDLAGDDLRLQGLPAEGRDAGERHARANRAAAHVRRRDRLLGGLQGVQRGRRAGARHGRARPVVLHALPVRQRGQSGRALQRHRARDPRGARRDQRVRRRPRNRAAR